MTATIYSASRCHRAITSERQLKRGDFGFAHRRLRPAIAAVILTSTAARTSAGIFGRGVGLISFGAQVRDFIEKLYPTSPSLQARHPPRRLSADLK